MNKNNDNNNNDDLPLFTTILELFGPLKSIGNYVCFICFIYIYICICFILVNIYDISA